MKYYFDSCDDAIQNAINNKQYGIYYSEGINANTDIHTHDTCEILLCLSGGESFLIGDKVYEVNDGDLFIINHYEAHKIKYNNSLKISRFVMEVSPEFLHQASTVDTNLSSCFYARTGEFSHKISLEPEQVKYMQSLFCQIKGNSGYALDVLNYSVVLRILVFINEKFFEQNQAEHPAEKDLLNNETLKKVIEYINLNYQNDDSSLSLDALSKYTYVSTNQLSRIFKKNTGTTIPKYILSKRISEAKKLLTRGFSVTDTAIAVGFRDYSNFIRVFKKNVGVSPGKYAEKRTD